jgi:hypothetical protein
LTGGESIVTTAISPSRVRLVTALMADIGVSLVRLAGLLSAA